jgi:NAD(P)H-dependent flavin oxidoreductase YrpB (nitropropane dioxygenase family)
MGTATTVEEAVMLEQAGCDAIVAQVSAVLGDGDGGHDDEKI